MRLLKITTAIVLAAVSLSASSCGLVKNRPTDVNTIGRNDVTDATTPASSETVTEAPESGEVRISFAAAGDNLIHDSVYTEAAARATALAASGGYSGKYYFDSMYSDRIKSIVSGADVAFVNQEGPMVPDMPAAGYPAFNAPTEAGDALVNMGFDIVNLANNHMLDMEGKCEGLRGTMNYWKSKNVLSVGAYESMEDYNTIRLLESKGKRIAVLSYTYGTNGNRLNAASSDLVIPLIDDSTIIDQVSRARDCADAVIVSMHWGEENVMTQNDEQKRLAALLSKYGADVVIGHHSHTLQPMEWVTGDSGKRTLVIYSLGNFISSQLQSYNMVGGLASFELVFAEDGSLTVENAKMNPTMTFYKADANVLDSQGLPTRTAVSVGLLEDFTSDMCAEHGSQLYGAFTLDTLRGYVTSTIPSEFLPDFLK